MAEKTRLGWSPAPKKEMTVVAGGCGQAGPMALVRPKTTKSVVRTVGVAKVNERTDHRIGLEAF